MKLMKILFVYDVRSIRRRKSSNAGIQGGRLLLKILTTCYIRIPRHSQYLQKLWDHCLKVDKENFIE